MGKIITVNFRGDELYGFENDEGIFVALKPICDGMGIQWNAQRERLNRDPILSEGTRVMRVPFGPGGAQETTCLRMDLVNGWLFTIDSGRIKDDQVREKVILYQRDCYSVLFKHFYKGAEKPERIDIEDHEQAHEAESTKVRLVTECRQVFGNRAAGQLWFQSGLPIVPAMIEEGRHMTLFDYGNIKTADPAAETKVA